MSAYVDEHVPGCPWSGDPQAGRIDVECADCGRTEGDTARDRLLELRAVELEVVTAAREAVIRSGQGHACPQVGCRYCEASVNAMAAVEDLLADHDWYSTPGAGQ